MKLMYHMLSEPMDFEEHGIYTLVLENPQLYRHSIAALLHGMDDVFILSSDRGIMSVEKHCAVLTDPFQLNPSEDKKILGGVQKEIAQLAVHERGQETAELFSAVHSYLEDLIHLSAKDLCYDDQTDPLTLLHLYHVRPDMESMNFCERLLFYLELMKEYTLKEVFVFCGLHLYMTSQEITSFLQDVQYRKLKVLLLEPVDCLPNIYSKKIIVDTDLCEI